MGRRHLPKVFAKPGISTRRGLHDALTPNRNTEAMPRITRGATRDSPGAKRVPKEEHCSNGISTYWRSK